MQVTIDMEQVASVTAGWFGENPWRLLIVYGVMTSFHGIRLARSLIKEVYEEKRKVASGCDPQGEVPDEMLLFAVAPLLAVTGGITFPFYAVWRVLRVGLGPIPE